MRLCFATNNVKKLGEIRALLDMDNSIRVVSLADIGCREELLETQNTLEGNSQQKARYVYQNYQTNCFADDTGLEVFSLDGEPGVYSARYAGVPKDDKANMDLLLKKMKSDTDRMAQFRTVITLIIDGEEWQFEGIVKGKILEKGRGSQGFGYDPIFQPLGYSQSFAQMDMGKKNSISHRGIAVNKLVKHLLGFST
ncbi:MAG: RdgB/HAM1 family non-canonical purine NTP pyrophosphatase [Bacteroidetes bacterium]|nr:RdgB/HAM1 family non-canonical purine NTP pyrophosphatase [Bacteroidota bacterium]